VIQQYNHSDWLGSARLITTASRTLSTDLAYAPYGEAYANNGWWIQFTSDSNQWTVSGNTGVDDFLYRRYHPTQGRWISPDPAGLAAADPANPQSWNRYAYVTNTPLSATDPLGLDLTMTVDIDGGGGCDWCWGWPGWILVVGGGWGAPPRPPAGPKPGPLKNVNWPNGETLGLPGGLNIQPLSLADLLGLAPGTSCEFGVCMPIGTDYLSGVTGNGSPESPWIYHVVVVAALLEAPQWHYTGISSYKIRTLGGAGVPAGPYVPGGGPTIYCAVDPHCTNTKNPVGFQPMIRLYGTQCYAGEHYNCSADWLSAPFLFKGVPLVYKRNCFFTPDPAPSDACTDPALIQPYEPW
jgi:RHS repeat-associated protein